MVRLFLAKEDTEVLEAITRTEGRNADHEGEGEKEVLVKCNCQLPPSPAGPRLDGGDQSDPFSC